MKEKFEGSDQKNVMSFTIGNDATETKASGSCGETQVASYALERVEDNDLVLIETVSSVDNIYPGDFAETKGTPIYTKNFDSKYSEQVYATAYAPVTASSKSKLTDVWGSYLENGGTVNLKNTDANTYSYDYSKGQKVNLSWPESGKLLYFIQAPYTTTNTLAPSFYSDGSIEFDYTDPTDPITVEGRPTIVNGASAQTDFLFTSKTISKPVDGSLECKANILMYHALTAVKFKLGNTDKIGVSDNYRTVITKVTFKDIKANGHCTITPNYTDANTSTGSKPSNIGGDVATKSSSCSKWISQAEDSIVDYTQSFSGVVDYTNGAKGNSSFGDSFYDGSSNLKNLGSTTDGSEILLMVPQSLKDVELVVYFKINGKDEEYHRSVKFSDSSEWKAGELHTYTLTVNKVDVSVTDTMNDPELTQKTNPDVKNTGNVTAYLRAAYTIAWYYGYGSNAIAVAAYLGNGEFTTGDNSGLSTRWIKGEDGFYYYPDPVRPNNSAKYKLFSQFDAPEKTETGPFQGAHLEMKILVQAVQFDEDESKKRVGDAWGEIHTVDADGNPTATTVVSLLGTTPEGSNL